MKRNLRKRTAAILSASAMAVNMMAISAFAAEEFIDVPRTMWCYDFVMEAAEKNFMCGYGDGLFGPEDSVTRSQLVQILFNQYGTEVDTDSGFPDVPADEWYAKAVAWAVSKGIVSGYDDGTFGPEDALTRQQMVAILYSQAGKPAVSGDLSKYEDREQVAPYAVDAFIWATTNGVISGTSATTLSPEDIANRAQIATVMLSFDKLMKADPVDPSDGKVYETAEELMATVSEDAQYYLNYLNMHTLTNPSDVNGIADVGKFAQTLGYTDEANVNGYHTEATVDVSGAVLAHDYEVLPILNRYRAEWLNNRLGDGYYNPDEHDLRWTIGDVGEETALACAKYAQCAEACAVNTTQANSVEEALAILKEQGRLDRHLSPMYMHVAAAHYTDAEGNTTYAFVFLDKRYPAGLPGNASENYGFN